MKIIFLLISTSFILLSNNTQAQLPSWLWVKGVGGDNFDVGNSICTDVDGNAIVVGNFTSDTIIFGADTNISAVGSNIFIAKYNNAGNVLWYKCLGGPNRTFASSVCTDVEGNIIVTGFFISPTITFGTISLFNNTGGDNIFVVKYDSNGNVLWAKSAGSISNNRAYGVCANSNGNIIITGYFFHQITFGTITLIGADTIQSSLDLFLVKYDSTGNVLWATSVGGHNNPGPVAQCVVSDPFGNIFITGIFLGPSITFGNTTLYNTDNSLTTQDVFIAKYDSSGNPLWAKSGRSNFMDYGNSISTDANGNVFLIGSFTSDEIIFGNTNLFNSDVHFTKDIFIVKFDSSGNALWMTNPAGGGDSGNGICTDGNGNVFVTGTIDRDIFVAEYDNNGAELWTKSTIDGNYSSGNSICTDADGNVFVSGYFGFPSCTFDSITLANAGSQDIFIARLDSSFNTGLINENNSFNLFSIFPNPTQGNFIIKLNAEIKNAYAEIYNTLGEVVYSTTIIKQQTINNKFPTGIYFVKVTYNNKQFIQKLIEE